MIRIKKKTAARGVLLLLVGFGLLGSREAAAQTCPAEFDWGFGKTIDKTLKAGSNLSFEVGLFLGWELDAAIRGSVQNNSANPQVCADYAGAPGGSFAMDMGLEVIAEICAKFNLPWPVPDIDFCADVPGIPTADYRLTDSVSFDSLLLGEERQISDSLAQKCLSASFVPIPGVDAGLELCGSGNMGFALEGSDITNGCGTYTGSSCVSCTLPCPTVHSTWRGKVRPTGNLSFRPCIFVDIPVIGKQNLCLPAAVTVPLPIPASTDLSLPASDPCDLTSSLCLECQDEIAQCRQDASACRASCLADCRSACESVRSTCRNACDNLPALLRPACRAACDMALQVCRTTCLQTSASCVSECDATEHACIENCLSGIQKFRRGDADGDGCVSKRDADYLMGMFQVPNFEQQIPCLDAADANDDGIVDVSDTVLILQYLKSGSPALPSPGPLACDFDPTTDDLDCRTYTANVCALAGDCVGPFLRADANADGSIDITDPVYTLGWLFLGDPEPPCLAAANANLDNAIDITDAQYTLNWLFLGGNAPREPHPQCTTTDFRADRFFECEVPHTCK